MGIWYLSHRRAAKGQTSLRIRAVSSDPSLLAHINDGNKLGSRQRFKELVTLGSCECMLKQCFLRIGMSVIFQLVWPFQLSSQENQADSFNL